MKLSGENIAKKCQSHQVVVELSLVVVCAPWVELCYCAIIVLIHGEKYPPCVKK